jgi:hypothetical protein
MLSGLERYVYGYHYDPNTVPNFSSDLALLPDDPSQLVVSPSQLEFYTIVGTYNGGPSVVLIPTENRFVSTLAAKQSFPEFHIERIITSGPYTNADRFYVYKKNDQ